MAKDLFTKNINQKQLNQKGKGSLKETKIKFKVLPQFAVLLDDISVPFSRQSFVGNLLIYPCKKPAANKSLRL